MASAQSPSVAGPVSRDDFLAAQRRHRRAAQSLNVLAAVAVVFVSVPLAAIVFPLLFGVAALVSIVASLAAGGPSLLDRLLATGGHFAEGEDAVVEAIGLGLAIVLPGAILLLAIWARSLKALASLEPAQLVEGHGTRLARPGDFEERQVSNVVEELAIAAAIPPPAVRIIDSDAINAAALAPDADGALILVTRGLLERCDRAETQALLASSVAMVANGDARAAFRWLGAAAAFNVAVDLLHGPLAREARERLRALLPPLRSGSLAGAADKARALDLLLGSPPSIPDEPGRGRVRTALLFPFLMASAMFNLVGFLANFLFLSPALSLLMRRRRYLADATAVQLTRDPESLARGLDVTVNRTASAAWPLARFTPLFLVAPTSVPGGDAPIGQSFGTHPPVAARHARIVRMTFRPQDAAGSTPHAVAPGSRGWLGDALSAAIVVLMALLVPLMLYLMIAVTMLALGIGMIWVLLALLPLNALLG